MGQMIFFIIMLFMVPTTLFSSCKTWRENEKPWPEITIQLSILLITLLVTIGPFFIMPMLGFRFGK